MEPNLEKLCTSNEESRCAWSVTEGGNTKPNQFRPMTESKDPILTRLWTNIEGSSVNRSRIDVARPSYERDRKESGGSGEAKSKASRKKPRRRKLLKDTKRPTSAQSKAKSENPKRQLPRSEQVELGRKCCLGDKKEPSSILSERERENPK